MKKNIAEYKILIAAGLFSFFNLLQLSLPNSLINYLLPALNINIAKFGLLSSAFLWGNSLGLIPIGILLDYFSLRKVGILFFSLTIGATFVFATTTTFEIFFILRFLQGMASAASLLIGLRLATKYYTNKNFSVGIFIAIALSGGIVGNSFCGYLNQLLGWRYSLIIIGIIGLILLLNFTRLPDKNLMGFNIKIIKLSEYSTLINKRNFYIGTYLGLMNSPVFILASLLGNYYLVTRYKISISQSANLCSLIFVGVIFGSLFWGRLCDRVQKSFSIMYVGVVFLLFNLIALWYLNFSFMLVLAILFFGLGFFSSTQNIIFTQVEQGNINEKLSASFGFVACLSNAVGAIMQILCAFFLRAGQSQVILNLLLLFCFGSFILLNKINYFSSHPK